MKKYFILYVLFLFAQVTYSQPREERYPNGKLKLLENYKNGMQHGLSSYYYENGIKSKEGNYENGKENGVWKIAHYNLTVLIENDKTDKFIKLRKK